MRIQLSIVEGVFELSGRTSVIVAPGIPRNFGYKVQPGDRITLERPDGSTLESFVAGIEMLSPPSPLAIPFQLGEGVTKDEVPIGTKLWIDVASYISD
jgi:hypothetical protein